MNRFVGNNIGLPRRKAESLLARVRSRIGGVSDVSSVLSNIYTTLKVFYRDLKKPLTKALKLGGKSKRSFDDYRGFLDSVKQDFDVLYQEASEGTQFLTTGFNYISALNDAVKYKTQRIASKAEDLALLNNTVDENIFIAGDNFADESKIDKQFQGVRTSAQVSPGGGSITLGRKGTAKVTDPKNTTVEVQTGPAFEYDPSSQLIGQNQDDPHKDYRVYEGHYFHYLGRMQPAGGKLRWVSLHLDAEGREVQPGEVSVSSNEGAEANERRADQERLLNARTTIIPDTPSRDELQRVRGRMFDDSPDSFWQIESTYNPFHLTDKEAFLEKYGESTPTARAEAFRQLVVDTEERDFDVFLILDLGQPRLFNWLNLDPENFGEEAWLEIISIDTAETANGPWTPIEGLFEHRFENTLTPEANQELTDAEVAATMSPSRYRYAGQGVWQFPPREAQFVRVGVRQKTPVPSPYQVIRYKLVRNITTTTTKTRERSFFSSLF